MKTLRSGFGWHILRPNGRLGYNDGRQVKVGSRMRYKGFGTPQLCYRGMHASKTIEKALDSIPTSISDFSEGWLCRIHLEDIHDSESDKAVGEVRRVLWRVRIKDLAVELFKRQLLKTLPKKQTAVLRKCRSTDKTIEEIRQLAGADGWNLPCRDMVDQYRRLCHGAYGRMLNAVTPLCYAGAAKRLAKRNSVYHPDPAHLYPEKGKKW